MEITTPNDYGMVWMSPSHMLMPQNQGMPSLPQEMLQLDPASSQLENPYYPMAVPPSFETGQPMEMDSFLMMDEYDSSYCDEPPRYMSAATQTGTGHSRKIKPIKHPGLKLQTPIAYKCDTDPSVIPIHKDGMAICEKCGAIGVKHSFYTRHRKYCSLACARGSLGISDNKDDETDDENSQGDTNQQYFKYPNGVEVKEDEELITKEAMTMSLDPPPIFSSTSAVSQFPCPNLALTLDEPVLPVQTRRGKQELANSYDWTTQLEETGFIAVPVSCFKHVPMSDCWDNITVGMKVEVENRDCDNFSEAFPDSFWVATVLRIAGYKALLRYEGFGQNNDKDFWVSLCSNSVHPVGWCATRGKPLIPPKTIEDKYNDWKEFLVKRLTGARTLPSNFYSKVQESLKSRFRIGLNVEVVDKNRISQVCVATVKKIVGKRLHVEYYNSEPDDNGFWCHEDSPLIHPVGWASRVGHLIEAPDEYKERCESGLIEKDDATEELFTAPQQSAVVNLHMSIQNGFREGMKLEAIDPLNLSSICVATVMKVLKDNYIMIRIDSYPPDMKGSDWFCYHISSPCIFPPGFCHKHSIVLTPPKDYEQGVFSWETYVQTTGALMAPAILFEREIPSHGFVVGMRLEAADLMDPRLVCVGTVSRVVGRLLKIHFDGWEEEYDQWLDCDSPDMYPVGWCHLVGHKLEGPRCIPPPNTIGPIKKRQRKRVKTKGKGSPPNKKSVSTASSELKDEKGQLSVEAGQVTHDENVNTENISPLHVVNTIYETPIKKEPEQSERDEEKVAPPPLPPVAATTTTTVSTTPPCSSVNNSTSNNTSSTNINKYIPRLIDSTGSQGSSETNVLNPSEWNVEDVLQFLKVNDCGAHAELFRLREVNGKSLLNLTKDQIMDIIGFKIGPTLKIFDLIQQLKTKANKANVKKGNVKC